MNLFTLSWPQPVWQQDAWQWGWELVGWTMCYFMAAGSAIALAGALLRLLFRRANPNVRYALSLSVLTALATTPVGIAAWLAQTLPAETIPTASPMAAAVSPLATAPTLPADPSPHVIDLKYQSILPAQEPEIDASSNTPTPMAEGSIAASLQSATENSGSPGNRLEIFNQAIEHLPWIWLFGTPLTFLLLTTGLIGSERLRRQSQLLNDGPIFEACRRLRTTLKISRRTSIAICERIAAPLLIGVVRPLILLPPAALTGWSAEELEMVLLHELAHVRRWDNLVNLLQRTVESLLFFHPAVWWVSHWVRLDREDCCDVVVVKHTAQPEAYAELLVTLATLTRPAPGLAMARHPLAGRIRRILKLEDEKMLVSRGMFGWLGLLIVAAIGITLFQPSANSVAKQQGETNTSEKEITDKGYYVSEQIASYKKILNLEIPINVYTDKDQRDSWKEEVKSLATSPKVLDRIIAKKSIRSLTSIANAKPNASTWLQKSIEAGFNEHDQFILKVTGAQKNKKELKVIADAITLALLVELPYETRKDKSWEAGKHPFVLSVDINTPYNTVIKIIKHFNIDPESSTITPNTKGQIYLTSREKTSPTTTAFSTQLITIEGDQFKASKLVEYETADNGKSAKEDPRVVYETDAEGNRTKRVIHPSANAGTEVGEKYATPLVDRTPTVKKKANAILPFLSLEDQRAADLAYKMLGLELEPLSDEELAVVNQMGHDGGLRVVQTALVSNNQITPQNACLPNDLLIGLHVWPVKSLQDVAKILQHEDIADMSPLKFYAVRSASVGFGGGGSGAWTKLENGSFKVVTGRVEVKAIAKRKPTMRNRNGAAGPSRSNAESNPLASAGPTRKPVTQQQANPYTNPLTSTNKAVLELELKQAINIYKYAQQQHELRVRASQSGGLSTSELLKSELEMEQAKLEIEKVQAQLQAYEQRAKDAAKKASPSPTPAASAQNTFQTEAWDPRAAIQQAELKLMYDRYQAVEQELLKAKNQHENTDSHPAVIRLEEEAQIIKHELARLQNRYIALAEEKATQVLYDGRTFQQWRSLWKNELKTENRTEAIKALAAFGRAGYGKQAAEAILDVAGEYDFHRLDSSSEGKLKDRVLKVLNNANGQNLNASLWLPSLLQRYEANPQKWKWLAINAISQLSFQSSLDEPNRNILLELARGDDGNLRSAAISGLGKVHIKNTEVIKLTSELIASNNFEKARDGVYLNIYWPGFDTSGHPSFLQFRSVPAMLQALQHPNQELRRLARDYLPRISKPDTISIADAMLKQLQSAESDEQRVIAIRAIAALGERAAFAAPTLRELTESDTEAVQIAASVAWDSVREQQRRNAWNWLLARRAGLEYPFKEGLSAEQEEQLSVIADQLKKPFEEEKEMLYPPKPKNNSGGGGFGGGGFGIGGGGGGFGGGGGGGGGGFF